VITCGCRSWPVEISHQVPSMSTTSKLEFTTTTMLPSCIFTLSLAHSTLQLCTKCVSNTSYRPWDQCTFVFDIHLMIHGNKLLVHFLVTFSPCVAYPGVRDNRSTLNTKTGYDEFHVCMAMMHLPTQFGAHIFIRTGDIWNFPKFIMPAATILVHGK